MNEPYLSYQEVFLMPEYSDFVSRDDVNTSVVFGPRTFKLPVVPANMKCVIDEEQARRMSRDDYFYIMHRFNHYVEDEPNKNNFEFVKRANEENWKTISISLGVQEYDKKFLIEASKNNLRIDYVTLDIAHAHSLRMKEMIHFMKSFGVPAIRNNWIKPFIIAGNVATPEAVIDLENWGADSVKVGIAQGGACTTYGMTGFGVPMFTCMLKCSEVARKPLIADGGIKTNGDIAKAVRAGGTIVMAGGIFAACTDSNGGNIYSEEDMDDYTKEILEYNKLPEVEKTEERRPLPMVPSHKVYYGSASEYNKHSKRHVEGTRILLPCNKLTYKEKLQEIADSYSSSISYSGNNLKNCKWGTLNQR